MKKFLTALSLCVAIFAAWTNNLLAQDSSDEGDIIITAQDEEYCPFCNALAAAQANNANCLIVVQYADGSMQATPTPAKCAKGDKSCATAKTSKTCPKCKTKMPTPRPSEAEVANDKALAE